MKIYIDLVIIINFIFDFILLSSVNYILRRNVKVSKLLLSSLLGELSLFILFFYMNKIFLLFIKFLISLLMLMVSFGYKDIRYLLKNFLYFYLVSMLLGGGIYFLNIQFSYTNKGLVFTRKGLGLSYIVVVIISLFIFLKYIKCFIELKNNYSNYYNGKIYFNNDDYLAVNAYLDTGNKLKDPYSDKCIILIQDGLIDCSSYKPIYVPYNSLNNHGLLTCYKALKIEIDGRCYEKFLVGISHENFFIDGINCIINSQIMEGLR